MLIKKHEKWNKINYSHVTKKIEAKQPSSDYFITAFSFQYNTMTFRITLNKNNRRNWKEVFHWQNYILEVENNVWRIRLRCVWTPVSNYDVAIFGSRNRLVEKQSWWKLWERKKLLRFNESEHLKFVWMIGVSVHAIFIRRRDVLKSLNLGNFYRGLKRFKKIIKNTFHQNRI